RRITPGARHFLSRRLGSGHFGAVNRRGRFFLIFLGVSLVQVVGSAAARADTMIDGGPVGGGGWTAAGSRDLVRGVNGNLLVPAGEELRIEAGTVVQLSNGWGSVLLTVEGQLTIDGTSAAPVVIGDTFDGDMGWMGISATTSTAIVRITGAV